ISENISYIDVVYEVLDARIPYSSKIKDIDNYIKDKPRIIVMTKIDLCDMVETNKWIKYYEDLGYKVIGMDLEHKPDIKGLINLTESVMEEANSRREAKGMLKRKTRVLIVGIPNAGKSTLINRLVGKKATNVGNKPGVTKSLDWIRINEKLELLDTPGILWPKLEDEKVAFNLASLTAIKEEVLPIYAVVEYIINTLFTLYPQVLKERYGLEEVNDDIIEVLDYIGKRRGCLIKGGEIDYDKVVSIIINEIKDGTIKNITFDRIEDYEK
ncbi:MAG: ribosome biogenesis GTPase YlqF, partial [Bacilli bacterium]|nr:ribosome biogenesis GTPase YlqF [Bacilli bacterium]